MFKDISWRMRVEDGRRREKGLTSDRFPGIVVHYCDILNEWRVSHIPTGLAFPTDNRTIVEIIADEPKKALTLAEALNVAERLGEITDWSKIHTHKTCGQFLVGRKEEVERILNRDETPHKSKRTEVSK